ncbi:MAG TPA: hypothetical protein VFV50_16760 [Bdellovibrionales bacterium]|nr:hypothetical protein [Bdellovibrionales bacterium]
MLRTLSILGVDGSGKTTMLKELGEKLSESRVVTLRVPQYHETEGVARPELSRALEELGVLADSRRDPTLKAMSLFLAMPLYSESVASLARGTGAELVITERHPLVDSLAYAPFYRKLLKGTFDWSTVPSTHLFVKQWARDVMSRWLSPADCQPEQLPARLEQLFALENTKLLGALKHIYRCDFPDQAILLSVTQEQLAVRIAAKGTREIHEEVSTLMALQSALKAAVAFAVGIGSRMTVHEPGQEQSPFAPIRQRRTELDF